MGEGEICREGECLIPSALFFSSSGPVRLEFSRSQHHVKAEVFCSSSPVPVISCSTKEWALKKQLPSTRCVAACQAVGEVLALRCQQAGINRMTFWMVPWAFRSDAVSAHRNIPPSNCTFSHP